MIKTFDELEEALKKDGTVHRIALAGAHDSHALKALIRAHREGIVDGVLIGEKRQIVKLLNDEGESESSYQIVDCDDEDKASWFAVEMVKAAEADMPMKGLIQTTTYMHAVLSKKNGLVDPGAYITQSTLVEAGSHDGLFQITDCAVMISPNLEQKAAIIRNAVKLAHALGYSLPRVAVVSATECVNEKIPSSVDAQKLKEMNSVGELTGCIVDGPLGFDNAISEEAARHKGIGGDVAGRADIVVVPDLCSGNILTKSLTFFANVKSAGCLLGARCPVLAASRSDTPGNKYRSIIAGIVAGGGVRL